LNQEVFAAWLIAVAHQLQFCIQGHLTYLASVEEQSLLRNVDAKNYLFLREGEWLLELRLPKVVPTVPFGSMCMGAEREVREVVALFGKYELGSAGLCELS
jgi:hypothetical protein